MDDKNKASETENKKDAENDNDSGGTGNSFGSRIDGETKRLEKMAQDIRDMKDNGGEDLTPNLESLASTANNVREAYTNVPKI